MGKQDVIKENIDEQDCLYDSQFAENQNVEDESEQVPSSEDKRELLKKTKIVKQTWSIQEIYQKIKNKRLKLSPEYQRNEIWLKDKQTAFVESLFMGIIVPPIYVVEIPGDNLLEDSTYEVVDGKQRLTTIMNFLTGKLLLDRKSLEYYRDWFGAKSFIQLQDEYSEMTSEMLSSVLDIYVITANSPEFTKYDIFSRLNKGAEKLKVNEIRKAIYRSHVLDIVDRFVKSNLESEDRLIKDKYTSVFSPNDIKRYEDYGRFYTSIAFYLRSNVELGIVQGYNSRPRDMINNVLQNLQNKTEYISDEDVDKILNATLDMRLQFSGQNNIDYIINSCIPFVIKHKELLDQKMTEIMKDECILSTLQKSPATTSNINNRLKYVKNIIFANGEECQGSIAD